MKKGLFTVAALALALFVVFCSTTRPVVRATGIVGRAKTVSCSPVPPIGYCTEDIRASGYTDKRTDKQTTNGLTYAGF